MNKNEAASLSEKLRDLSAEAALEHIFKTCGSKAAIASSFGAEDQVLTAMAAGLSPEFKVFTLDTGRLPQETFDVMQETMKKYGLKWSVMFPKTADVEEMESTCGPNLFYESVENRKLCCNIRKVRPLKRALAGLSIWITGLRREQAVTRGSLEIIEWDESNGLLKANPLAAWTEKQVWDYIKENKVPYNKLHDSGYPSIGCAPCTRAVKPGEDVRAGRWWWETPEQKECGLHIKDGKVFRDKA